MKVKTDIPNYKYPLFPFNNDPSQIMFYSIVLDYGDGTSIKSIDSVLDYIKKVDILTRGVSKVVRLVGWQERGHDYQYPCWGPVNSKLKRLEDSTARDSLLYLMNTAESLYHTKCTVHVNLLDAYQDSPLWSLYIANNWICRNLDGSYVTGGTWNERQAYIVNIAKEWEDGYLQQRIDNLVALLPPLKDTVKYIYTDAQGIWQASPYNNYSYQDMVNANQMAIQYMKTKYGIDNMIEWMDKELYGFSPFGQSGGYNQYSRFNEFSDPMVIPAYVMGCGNHGLAGDMESIFGSDTQLEDQEFHDDVMNVLREFTHTTLPYLYMNQYLRDYYDVENQKLYMSDGVISYKDNDGLHKVIRDGNFVKIGNDVFIPEPWKENREIMAYSHSGKTRTWKFPSNWDDIHSVDIYNLDKDGLIISQYNVDVSDQKITLSLNPLEGVVIVPAGADVNNDLSFTPSGFVTYIGKDSNTRGDWRLLYGTDGYYIAGYGQLLPLYAKLSFKLGSELIWDSSTMDTRALQKPDQSGRIASVRTASIHEIIDVNVGNESRNIALYFLDYNDTDMQVLVDVIDANNSRLLDSQLLNEFQHGVYLRYSVTGRVHFRITQFYFDDFRPAGSPGFSGVFFG